MKKIRYVFVLLLMFNFFSCGQGMNSTSQPDNPSTEENTKIDVSYSTYKHYVDEGVLGEDISYDVWKTLVERSYELEKILSNQHEFEEVYSSENQLSWGDFVPLRGDVFITNGTSSAGILGHAGIAISGNSVLHVAGPDCHPENITFSDWHNAYTNKDSRTWTKVYRHIDEAVADVAADWAENTYESSYAEYKITAELWTTDVTYCSKIVWQAYHYGPEYSQTYGPPIGFVDPHSLPDAIMNLRDKHTYYKE